ncbi:heavy metal transporter [Flavobacteriales bacterium 34_180_T64]|nr:heavy metal transporter [Flavobacteriales bacterium 34_180_T64]
MNTTLEIQNLKCGGCANTIRTRLEELGDVDSITVNTDENSVSFDYKNDSNINEVKVLLSRLGYPVLGELNPLTKKAKSFVSCAVGRMKN